MSFIADKDVNVASVNGRVNLAAAKEIILECGGAFIQIKDGSITLGGPYDLFLKTITVQKKSKASLNTPMPSMPTAQLYDEQVQAIDAKTGEFIPGLAYYIKTQSGVIYMGHTDAHGLCERITTSDAEELTVLFGEDAERMMEIR